MFRQNLLKAKIIEKDLTILQLSNEIGICEATFYRKLSRNGDFTRFEIMRITDILDLSVEERDAIFFEKELT